MISSYLSSLRRIGRDARLCLLAWALIGFAAFGGIFTVLGNLYLLRLGFGPESVGLFNAAGQATYSACALPAATLGRRWGSRRPMIVGLALGMLGLGLLPLAEALPFTWRDGGLLAAFAITWGGISLFWINSKPFLTAVTGPEERDHAFSMWMAITLFSGFVGSLISGFLPGLFGAAIGVPLDQPAPYRFPLWIAAACLGLAALAMLSTHPASGTQTEEARAEAGGGGSVAIRLILVLALVSLLRPASEAVARTFFNVYLDAGLHAPTVLIGALSAGGQLVAVPAALAAPLVMARWGHVRTYAAGSLAAALCLLPLAVVPHWSMAGLGFAGVIGLTSLAVPAANVFAMALVPFASRPVMSAAVELAVGFNFAAAAFGGGYLITAAGYPSLFLAGAVLSLAGTVLFWGYFSVPRGELARVEARPDYQRGAGARQPETPEPTLASGADGFRRDEGWTPGRS